LYLKKNYILPHNNLDYYQNHGLFESSLIEWCKQFGSSDKIFLDIGSHSGTYAISLAKHFAKVYAFEPQRMTYYTLCGSVALSNLDNVHCLNFGLGSAEQVGNKELKIISADGGGSTIQELQPHQQLLATETIEIRTLDSLQLENVGFIKMDVEGNELDVLRGAISSIS
jgi:FkbM family methyltransferase